LETERKNKQNIKWACFYKNKPSVVIQKPELGVKRKFNPKKILRISSIHGFVECIYCNLVYTSNCLAKIKDGATVSSFINHGPLDKKGLITSMGRKRKYGWERPWVNTGLV
jgi:hypothetical protein